MYTKNGIPVFIGMSFMPVIGIISESFVTGNHYLKHISWQLACDVEKQISGHLGSGVVVQITLLINKQGLLCTAILVV